jgi:hypothetical protein
MMRLHQLFNVDQPFTRGQIVAKLTSEICIFIALLFVTMPSANAQLEGTYEVQINKKAEEKKSNRWTMADWLAWKEEKRAQDLWLAKNSHSSPYEFALELGAINYTLTNNATPNAPATNTNHESGEFIAYAGVAGLRGSYQTTQESQSSWLGSFNLRIFGRAIQDTHINLEWGLRGLNLGGSSQTEAFQNQYGGVETALYFTKHFGVDGTYRRILPAQSDQGRTTEGELSNAGVFIDFGPTRFFGRWELEYRRYLQNDSGTSEFRQGFGGGIRYFF